MPDNDPLDAAGLRQMARAAADTVSNRQTHGREPDVGLHVSTDALALCAAILNAGATIAEQLRHVARATSQTRR